MKAFIPLATLFLFSTLATAHMDDSGDIHPNVTLKENRFVVRFRNSFSKNNLKTVVAENGRMIHERIPDLTADSEKVSDQNVKIPGKYSHHMWTSYNPAGGQIFQPLRFGINYGREKHQGKPVIIQVLKDDFQNAREIHPAWGAFDIDEITHFGVTANHCIVFAFHHVPENDPDRSFKFYTRPLFLHSFAKVPPASHTVEVGVPYRIYHRPLMTQICERDSKIYVAWMGGGEKVGAVLNLTEYDPVKNQLKTKKLIEGHGNSLPSMQILKNRALIAFHKPRKMSTSYFGTQSQIVIHSLLLDDFDSIVPMVD